jgi:hypothetical protein
LIIGGFKYIFKKLMGTRAKEAFNYRVCLDQFDEEISYKQKIAHLGLGLKRNFDTTHINSELMCRNLTNFKHLTLNTI